MCPRSSKKDLHGVEGSRGRVSCIWFIGQSGACLSVVETFILLFGGLDWFLLWGKGAILGGSGEAGYSDMGVLGPPSLHPSIPPSLHPSIQPLHSPASSP